MNKKQAEEYNGLSKDERQEALKARDPDDIAPPHDKCASHEEKCEELGIEVTEYEEEETE